MLDEFHFLRPWWLLLLVPTAILVVSILRRESGEGRWRGLIAPHLLPHLLVGEARTPRLRPGVLVAVLAVFGILGLAGPTARRLPSPFTADEIAVAIVVDCGATMDTEDVEPSRVERAGQKVRDLLEKRRGVQAALFAYAGTAHRVMPFTGDAGVVSTFAATLRPALMPEQGDVTAEALERADRELRDLGKPGAIVLLTDGFRPNSARVRAPVHILGVARSLDEVALRAAAARWGGTYRRVTPDDTDVVDLANSIERRLAPAADENRQDRWDDAGYWLVVAMLVPAAFWFRRGWTVRHD